MTSFRCSSVVTPVLAAALVFGGWQTAWACGNALIYSFLFAKHPEAGIAYKAELAARKDGLYQAAQFPNQPGLSYHKWSFSRATAALERVHERLRRYHASAPSSEVSASLMLADEVYVAELSTTSEGPRFTKSLTGLQQRPRIDAYTTVNALVALEDGEIGWRKAVERGLVVPASDTTNAPSSKTCLASCTLQRSSRSVCFGSLADIRTRLMDDRFRPRSRRVASHD